MPTSSFDKEFIISDPEALQRLLDALENPEIIKIKKEEEEENA